MADSTSFFEKAVQDNGGAGDTQGQADTAIVEAFDLHVQVRTYSVASACRDLRPDAQSASSQDPCDSVSI